MTTQIAIRRPLLETALNRRQVLLQQRPGAFLFEEGKEPGGIYLIHSSAVDLLFRSQSGELKLLRPSARGEILGLEALVSGHAHELSARARTTCEVGFVSKESFFRMLDEFPDIWLDVLELLSRDVKNSYAMLRTVAVQR